jgi:hypothetical protein
VTMACLKSCVSSAEQGDVFHSFVFLFSKRKKRVRARQIKRQKLTMNLSTAAAPATQRARTQFLLRAAPRSSCEMT